MINFFKLLNFYFTHWTFSLLHNFLRNFYNEKAPELVDWEEKSFLLINTLCMKKILENFSEDENFCWSWFFGDLPKYFFNSAALTIVDWAFNLAIENSAPLNNRLKISIAPGRGYSWILRTKNGPYMMEFDKRHFTDENFALWFLFTYKILKPNPLDEEWKNLTRYSKRDFKFWKIWGGGGEKLSFPHLDLAQNLTMVKEIRNS